MAVIQLFYQQVVNRKDGPQTPLSFKPKQPEVYLPRWTDYPPWEICRVPARYGKCLLHYASISRLHVLKLDRKTLTKNQYKSCLSKENDLTMNKDFTHKELKIIMCSLK